MKTKKAASVGLQFIVVLIITLIFVVIYFVWLRDFRIFGENLSDYTICQNSNIENAKLKLKIDNQVIQERQGNKCKTEYIEVPKDEELAFIAKKMAGCWDMYLEGKEELFETKDNNFCAICSVLTFKEKGQFTGLTSYLMETKAPNQGGLTYYEYMNNVRVTKEQIDEVKNSDLDKLQAIDTTEPWAVIFVMGKDVNPGSLTGQSSLVTAGEAGTIGAIAGTLILVGFGLCSTVIGCTVGGFFIAAGFATTGYLIGSDYNPDVDSRILLWQYTNEDLSQLKCTMLEGQDRLDIRK